ncbi:uncharacterized protein CEXT_120971 [Caerostris extrusa]|uniref:Uncharacterized protein n=1 Tax=Caerostris extrusa TaxID=172846 RepID=A0AAV4XU28_CAEEX|nr:uncharacterized protein CEXT_120971 [Caerostris extrusa]
MTVEEFSSENTLIISLLLPMIALRAARVSLSTKFLCSQVTAPIRNEDGVICMFIVNFEDITNAPYRDAAVSPLPSPARIQCVSGNVSKHLRVFLRSGIRPQLNSKPSASTEFDVMSFDTQPLLGKPKFISSEPSLTAQFTNSMPVSIDYASTPAMSLQLKMKLEGKDPYILMSADIPVRLLNRFPALWRLVPRSRLKPGHARDLPLKGCEGSLYELSSLTPHSARKANRELSFTSLA